MMPLRTLLCTSWPRAIAACAAIALIALGGCSIQGTSGSLRTQSLGNDPVVFYGNFTSAYFSHSNAAGTSFMLTVSNLDDVASGKVTNGQLLHVQLLWLPKAGSTPMEASATNASIRYVVISGGEVGVYSGAGFAMLGDSLDSKRVSLSLQDATLQLQESTPGFRDVLSPAHMTGTFTARRDDNAARQLNHAASQLVTNALGRTRIVYFDQTEQGADPLAFRR